jgi:hypothetical protein
MVWGAIGPSVAGEGAFRCMMHCTQKVDGPEYVKLIEEAQVVEKLDEFYGAGSWIFMQDGAPAHTAAQTTGAFEGKMSMIGGWPPNSCDLNPIA